MKLLAQAHRSVAIAMLFGGAVGCSRGSQAELAPSPAEVTPRTPSKDSVPSPLGVKQQSDGDAGQLSRAVTLAELDRRTADLFGAALKVDVSIPMPADSGLAAVEMGPSWDIDVRSYETFERVRHYVTAFTGSSRDYFVDRLSRGTRYEQMIRAKLRAGGLPEDMYYLAFVESGYDPNAYSRAAAVGMWQFMTTTARGMGLRVDWWIDERRDPVRATDAAVRFLRGLNEQFGSLYLAAAAYNGGPGRIARGLSRYADELEGTAGDDMFFALVEKKYLRNETREYVPQLIAAALVAKEPDRYGISLVARNPFGYDSVVVGPRTPLAAVAAASAASVDAIKELNPHILRGMTPPGPRDSTYVRIPTGTRAAFDSIFGTLSAEQVTGARIVKAEKGATWALLAKKNKVSAKSLSQYNPKVKAAKSSGLIAVGTPVLIPSPSVVSAAVSVPDPAIERYGAGTRSHVVRRGENLSVIAKRYKTTPAAIMKLNRLKKPLIFPGQELRVRP